MFAKAIAKRPNKLFAENKIIIRKMQPRKKKYICIDNDTEKKLS